MLIEDGAGRCTYVVVTAFKIPTWPAWKSQALEIFNWNNPMMIMGIAVTITAQTISDKGVFW